MKHNRCGYNLLLGLMACLLVAISGFTEAWGQTLGQFTINYIEASGAPTRSANEINAYVTVSDTDENPVQGLSTQNFEVLEDGRKVDIEGVSQSSDPMAVVLAIDTSGSMQAQDKSGTTSMEAAKMAAMEFVSMLGVDDKVALFSFNNQPDLLVDFSVNRDGLVDALDSLNAKPNAATCLYDTAYEAVKKAAEIPKGRRAIILLTDGRDEKAGGKCSTYSVGDVIDAATTKAIRVPIYTIGVGPRVDAKELGRIASLTGGRSLLATSLAELPRFYQAIASQLKNQYKIQYLTQCPSGEHSLVIKVQYNEGKKQDEKRFWSPPLPVAQSPVVNFISPGLSDKIRDIVTVSISITPEDTVSRVRFFVDAVLKKEYNEPPFDTFEWDTAGLPGGLHILRAEVIDINGQTGYSEKTVEVISPTVVQQQPVPSSEAARGKKGIPVTVWLALLALVIIIAAILLFFFRFRREAEDEEEEAVPIVESPRFEPPREMVQYDGDETQFVGDFGLPGEAVSQGDKAQGPLATLTVVKSMNLDPGKIFEVITGTTTIGRTSANDIFIPDKPVSRNHAAISYDGSCFHIHDLGSKNGTKVDGKDVSSERTKLHDGAQIQLSTKTILEFNLVPHEEEECSEDDVTKVSQEDFDEDDKTKVYE